jgi:hypothetical protein
MSFMAIDADHLSRTFPDGGIMKTRTLGQIVFVAMLLLLLRDTNRGRVAGQSASQGLKLKTEAFDRDPDWVGVNNRIARSQKPRTIRQDFGFSPSTRNAGGKSPGEIGGFVTPSGEAASYGKPIPVVTFQQPISASGILSVSEGGTNLLLGFYNAETASDWRTPNTIAIRINGRGDKFFAYVEYCTSRWRAGGDTTPFPSTTDPKTGRWNLIGFPCRTSLPWSLKYDPQGNNRAGSITATIGDATAVCNLDESHKSDDAVFNRFGILNVVKSADSGSEIWLDDISINGGDPDPFATDPNWEGHRNRLTDQSRIVRPWFDFGFSETSFADGKGKGELGGRIFRGDCRYPERMASYGDRVGPLSLKRPLKASGKITMTHGVTDSTALLGFFNSEASLRSNESQNDGVPDSVLGIHIEGPSRDGFRFYPVVRGHGIGSQIAPVRDFPLIHPEGNNHDWSLDYDPDAAHSKGKITVTLDGHSASMVLAEGTKERDTMFDRFGIVTSWIDGNSQVVYWDDITYTASQN